VTDYDEIADRFDRRYALYGYDGVRDTLLDFLGPTPLSTLDVGCGTGHWLEVIVGHASTLAGMDPSAAMLAQARTAAPGAHLAWISTDHHLPNRDRTCRARVPA
jgi:ubiquinone/menaquinone biosynthesis C-methylase UbiE